MSHRPTVVFDFDGVIHEYSRGWANGKIYDPIDVGGITLAHQRGYAVAVVTARGDIDAVARALEGRGVAAMIDTGNLHRFWDGGTNGNLVLVTNRKVAAVAYIDDRAVLHQFGTQTWEATFTDVDALARPSQCG